MQAVTGGERHKIDKADDSIAHGDLGTQARDAKEWEDNQEIHHRAGGGDQDFIPAAKGVASSDVHAAELNSAFVHRHAEIRGCQNVTCFVKQKTREQKRT